MKKHKPTSHHHQPELSSWRRLVVRKWLNIPDNESNFSADTDSDTDLELETVGFVEGCVWPRESRFKNEILDGVRVEASSDALPRLRRRKSETFRAQYIHTKDIRICAATWNVGGRVPADDLDLDDWLDIDDPADIYVIGLQEVIPLNAGNIFGAEDSRPIIKWENLIRETLNQIPPATKFKSFSDPPSPSKFKPFDDAPDIEEEIELESDSDAEEEIYPLDEKSDLSQENNDRMLRDIFLPAVPSVSNNDDYFKSPEAKELWREIYSPKKLARLNCLRTDDTKENVETPRGQPVKILRKVISVPERIGLSWPEQPLHLLPQTTRTNSFNFSRSSKASKTFETYNSFKSNMTAAQIMASNLASLAKLDLEFLINKKRRPSYVRIVSKQMVGIFITVWVHRSLRRHIQNLNVSSVGVGVMGYIGNKGSISVSMSIHQTLFCFICSHLTSGEKEGDAAKRNADVLEIHKRTHFNSVTGTGIPKTIYDHEKILWLGDLNYRINLSYEQARELISRKDWSKLLEWDQLKKELQKGHVFYGWSEGTLNFPPTYKYVFNSTSYDGEDPKAGKRTPSWCDRILSYGTGMKLLSYKRSELTLSDHRPVTASYTVEVEVFSARKLQRALTYTDAEIGTEDIMADIGLACELHRLTLAEDESYWES